MTNTMNSAVTALSASEGFFAVRCPIRGTPRSRLGLSLFVLLFASTAFAQPILEGNVDLLADPPQQQKIRKAVPAAVIQQIRAAPVVPSDPPADDPEPYAASLNTNEELEQLLQKADALIENGRPDLAPVLWQRVLDEGTAVLALQAGGTDRTTRHRYRRYRPLRDEAERRIAGGGPAALKAYRLTADGHAKALLATDDEANRTRVLAEVVRRFLLSSVGDQAAFELACRHLERGEHSAAAQLLTKLAEMTESQIPREAIAVRLAVALSRLGASQAAVAVLDSAAEVPADFRALLATELQSGRPTTPIAVANVNQWSMSYGTPFRTGTMPSLAAQSADRLALAWDRELNYALKQRPTMPSGGGRGTAVMIMNGRRVAVQIGNDGRVVQPSASGTDLDITREALAKQALTAGWRPTGELLQVGSSLLVRAEDRIVCCDAETGKVRWMGRKAEYPKDPDTEQRLMFAAAGMRTDVESTAETPLSLTEVALFGDRVPQSMAVVGDLVIAIEGPLRLSAKPREKAAQEQVPGGFFPGMGQEVARRSRETWLSAYDLRTGKLKWYRGGPAGADKDAPPPASLLGSPLSIDDLLFSPLLNDGRIRIEAQRVEDGATIWGTDLCDAPNQGLQPWAPITLAADDAAIYISTGAGAVFAVNRLDGRVLWATTYPRRLTTEQIAQNQMGMRVVGAAPPAPELSRARFTENLVVRVDDLVIAMAADSDDVIALDSRSGALRWEAPLAARPSRDAVQYCLGVRAGKLYLAGSKVLRRYGLKGGRLEWERPLNVSCGRGLLTDNVLYVPQNREILRLDPNTGDDLGTWPVPTTNEEQVGNLFTDGKRLYCIGIARLSAFDVMPAADKGGL